MRSRYTRTPSFSEQMAAGLAEQRGQLHLSARADMDTRVKSWGARLLGVDYAPPREHLRGARPRRTPFFASTAGVEQVLHRPPERRRS